MKTFTWVITEDLRQRHSEWMEMFRCGKEVVEILPIDLTWTGHEIDLTSGHEYKKWKVCKLYELLTLSGSKNSKTLGLKLWLRQDIKLAKLRFEVTSLNVTWRTDLNDLGSNFLHKMRKWWINSRALRGAKFWGPPHSTPLGQIHTRLYPDFLVENSPLPLRIRQFSKTRDFVIYVQISHYFILGNNKGSDYCTNE